MPLSKSQLLLCMAVVTIRNGAATTAKKCFSCVEGKTAYQQIQTEIGPGAVQSPDNNWQGKPCHTTETPHITCENTTTHPTRDRVFNFRIHLEEDCEPVKLLWDRQRVEILVGSSRNELLGSGGDFWDEDVLIV